jgi:hypothetical protein
VFCHGNLPLSDYVALLELSRHEIDPNEYQQWRRGVITATVTKCVLLWADRPSDRPHSTRDFIL